MAKLFANSEDPDQMPHSPASDLGLHCLPSTFYGSPDYNGLMLSLLLKKFSRWHFILFFLFFPENRICHFMQIVSRGRDNLHESSDKGYRNSRYLPKCQFNFKYHHAILPYKPNNASPRATNTPTTHMIHVNIPQFEVLIFIWDLID